MHHSFMQHVKLWELYFCATGGGINLPQVLDEDEQIDVIQVPVNAALHCS